MFTRTARMLSVLALGLSFAGAAVADEPRQPGSAAAAIVAGDVKEAKLTNAQLKKTLENLGYEVTTTPSTSGGEPVNYISFKRAGWEYHIGVNVSPNGKYIWTLANLQSSEVLKNMTSTQLTSLLNENWHIHPYRFQTAASGLYLAGALDTKALTSVKLREMIDETADKVQSTQALWDVKPATATADAAKK